MRYPAEGEKPAYRIPDFHWKTFDLHLYMQPNGRKSRFWFDGFCFTVKQLQALHAMSMVGNGESTESQSPRDRSDNHVKILQRVRASKRLSTSVQSIKNSLHEMQHNNHDAIHDMLDLHSDFTIPLIFLFQLLELCNPYAIACLTRLTELDKAALIRSGAVAITIAQIPAPNKQIVLSMTKKEETMPEQANY